MEFKLHFDTPKDNEEFEVGMLLEIKAVGRGADGHFYLKLERDPEKFFGAKEENTRCLS